MSKKRRAPICPACNSVAKKVETNYGVKYVCCGLWAWGRFPLKDGATHRARSAAHAAFDPLWQRHGMTRNAAYAALAEELGIEPKDCHMKLMDREVAEKVPAIARKIALQLHGLVA